MPDHVHFLIEGQSESSNAEAMIERGKQLSGYWFRKTYAERLWQKSSWDRALRNDEDTLNVIRYIAANPVRAGLVSKPSEHPFTGSSRFTREQLEGAFD